jgi:hypothetical protein
MFFCFPLRDVDKVSFLEIVIKFLVDYAKEVSLPLIPDFPFCFIEGASLSTISWIFLICKYFFLGLEFELTKICTSYGVEVTSFDRYDPLIFSPRSSFC